LLNLAFNGNYGNMLLAALNGEDPITICGREQKLG